MRLFAELTPDDLASEEPESIQLAQALSLAASVREGMPELHSEQVSELSGSLAQVLELPPDVVLRCRIGGWLHDIGKVAIPDRILAKRGPLDEEEWLAMRAHAEIGEQIIRVVAVSDAFSAITSDRVYARGRATEEALRELRQTAGAHHDPAVVAALAPALELRHGSSSPRLDAEAA